MNDASSNGSDHSSSSHGPTSSSNDEASRAAAVGTPEAIREEKKRAQRDQKTAMLDHLVRNIDITIYAQLSALYYMDCSLLYFLLRALPHWFYFTPKPSVFPPPPVTHRPYIGIIFGTNILCMLLHLIIAPSAAGEATRGYLHGGLLIDFVGQKSPVGKWKLMGIDFLVLTLQILMLGITRTSRAIDTDSERSGIVGEVTDDQRQDHDSEERGILRQPAQDPSAVGAFEMQDLRHISELTGGDGDAERDELLWQPDGIEARHQHHLDHYYAGECMIANLHIVENIRAQWQAGGVSAENSRSSASGVQAAVVAAAAGRTLTYRLNEGIQNSQ